MKKSEAIGPYIKKVMWSKNILQSEVLPHISISRTALSNFINGRLTMKGKYQGITFEHLCELLEACGTNFTEFEEWFNDDTQPKEFFYDQVNRDTSLQIREDDDQPGSDCIHG